MCGPRQPPPCQTLLNNANDPNLEMADPYEPAVIDDKPVINYGGVAFPDGRP